MQPPALQQRLATYRQWKQRLERAVSELEDWLEGHRRASPRARRQIQAARETLERDRLTVAVVAAAARGRTELIHALFFSDLGWRLLPAAPGQSSPCPIEILWDDGRNEAYVRLLPVETRAKDASVADLKGDPKHWVHYPLQVQSPAQMETTLREILQTKTVSRAEATRLGLTGEAATGIGEVEIPKWRHAIVSLPHPLLKLGLAVLVTPGTGALAREAELADSVLASAQAALFVLAADRGATREDLHIWQSHLQGFRTSRERAVLVALNKTDPFADERREGASLEAAVALRRRAAAQALGIGEEQVFSISAHKGLTAKVRRDDGLLRRSALPMLEQALATRLLEAKHGLLIEVLEGYLGQLLDRNRNRVASRIARVKTELDELEQLRDKSQGVMSQLLERTRRKQESYLRGVQQFQRRREELLAETRLCRRILEPATVEATFEQAHRDLAKSVSTLGLDRAMQVLVEDVRRSVDSIGTESERIRRLVRDTYRVFRDELALKVEMPKVFAPMKYRVEVELLVQEVEGFRRSPAMLLQSRGAVIRRFDQQIVSRARVLFDQLRTALDDWIQDTLEPLATEIREHKARMEDQLANLQHLARSRDALEKRIEGMQAQHVALAQELTALRNIHNALHYDPLAEQALDRRPRLVSR